APVVHVSFFEADAFARWSKARLPTEFELEAVCDEAIPTGSVLEDRLFHPRHADVEQNGVRQLLGDVWEWTTSSYGPYPGYAPPEGAIGEYNGKFMCNQYVLRGGSCVTPRAQIRKSYRNFFHPEARWAFSGIRLARTP
ncbi:MAG: SUMF1/EgtB/PvdO family nonheme iron enzyme, partial [Cyanobacteria bacterium J06648_11]